MDGQVRGRPFPLAVEGKAIPAYSVAGETPA